MKDRLIQLGAHIDEAIEFARRHPGPGFVMHPRRKGSSVDIHGDPNSKLPGGAKPLFSKGKPFFKRKPGDPESIMRKSKLPGGGKALFK